LRIKKFKKIIFFKKGGKVECGGKILEELKGNYVLPTLISGLKHNSDLVLKETFAPICYILKLFFLLIFN